MTGSSFLGRATRAVSSLLPIIGILSRPNRPMGLTAIMRVRDEATWLEPSIRSIASVADQIVAGDNGSTDGSSLILRKLSEEMDRQLEVRWLPALDIAALTNALLQRARYRWVIRWDADFVAHTDGPRDIQHFRTWLLSRDPRRYFMVYPRMVELAGDLFHQDPLCPTRADAHCFIASPSLSYVYDSSGYEAPRVPRWYRVDRFDTPCFVHVNVKSDERLYRSYLWKQWLTDGSRSRGESFEDYLRRRTGEEPEAFRRAAAEWTLAYCRRLRPLDRALLPDYPAMLRPYLQRPMYRLIYSDGRLVARHTTET